MTARVGYSTRRTFQELCSVQVSSVSYVKYSEYVIDVSISKYSDLISRKNGKINMALLKYSKEHLFSS